MPNQDRFPRRLLRWRSRLLPLGLGLWTLAASSQAQERTALGDLGGFSPREFSQLSNRTPTQQGQRALSLSGMSWLHGESEHFIYHWEAGILSTQLAVTAELFYRGIKADLGITDDNYERKGRVFMFKDSSWEQFAAQARLANNVEAFQSANELFAHSRANQNLENTTSFPHELVHLVVQRFVGDIPLWLNEGLAEIEGLRQRVRYLRRRSDGRVGVHSLVMKRTELMPLSELTGLAGYPAGNDRMKVYYQQATLLVQYLWTEYGDRASFLSFVRSQAQGSQFDSAMRKAYGAKYTDLGKFEEAFAQYVENANKRL